MFLRSFLCQKRAKFASDIDAFYKREIHSRKVHCLGITLWIRKIKVRGEFCPDSVYIPTKLVFVALLDLANDAVSSSLLHPCRHKPSICMFNKNWCTLRSLKSFSHLLEKDVLELALRCTIGDNAAWLLWGLTLSNADQLVYVMLGGGVAGR